MFAHDCAPITFISCAKDFWIERMGFLAVIFALGPSVYVHAPVQMGDLRG